jgi:hypothetical protein
MLDYLEAELDARMELCNEDEASQVDVLKQSLLWHYISSEPPESRSTRKRIVKAVLAMDTSESRSSYPEIWEEETLEPTIPEQDTFQNDIDIEKGHLGDFGRADEDVVMQNAPSSTRTSTSRRRRGQGSALTEIYGIDEDLYDIGSVGEAVERLGGVEALQLRCRLLTLLGRVAQILPTQFGDFFDIVTEEFLHLPTMFFSPVVSMGTLSRPLQMALNANLLLFLVHGGLPDLQPTQSHLEDYLLPSRASTETYARNAKLSLIIEQMFMYMMSTQALEATDSLRKAVERGCEERGKVYGTGRIKKGDAAEEGHGRLMLQSSTDRLLGLLEILEISKGKPPQPRRDASHSLSLSFTSELSSLPESDMEEDE